MQNIAFHEIANLFELVHGKDFVDLKEDIKKNGVHQPIVMYEDMILDGRNRFRACQETGVSPDFVDYQGEDPVGYVISLNLHRRHMNESQRAMAAAKLATLTVGRPGKAANLPDLSSSEAANKLHVSERSVRTAKSVHNNGAKSLIDAVTQGDISVSTAATAATLPKEEQEEIVEEVKAGAKPAEAVKAHVSHNTGNNEWYTPAVYIEAARLVMGCIDLDPASSALANETVKAGEIYTEESGDPDNLEWFGNVWLNPPYAQPLIKDFSDRLCSAVDGKQIEQAIVLVNNATETVWFQNMARRASAICFPEKRIKFVGPEGEKGQPLQGQAFLYFGDDSARFVSAFFDYGFTLRHV